MAIALARCWAAVGRWEPTLMGLIRVLCRLHQAMSCGKRTLSEALLGKLGELEALSKASSLQLQDVVSECSATLSDNVRDALQVWHNAWMDILRVCSDEPGGESSRIAHERVVAAKSLLLAVLKSHGFSYVTATFNDPAFSVRPADEASLWRYLTKSKFVDLITTSSIYLSRIDRLGEPFEGSLPAHSMAKALYPVPENRQFLLRFFFASCWHVNQHESAGMWNLYLGGQPGIAIQTTAKKLLPVVSISIEGRIDSGLVTYADYESGVFDDLGPVNVFFHKRLEYAHEREFRVLYHCFPPDYFSERTRQLLLGAADFGGRVRIDSDRTNTGVSMPAGIRLAVDLSCIEKIRVREQNDRGLRAWVQAIADETGCVAEIGPSSLEETPRF